MSVVKTSAVLTTIFGVALAGWVLAQDDQGFEALLQDLSAAPVTAAAPEAAVAEPVLDAAPAAEEPVAEAAPEPMVEAPAEVAAEPLVEAVAEPVLEPAPEVVAAPVEEVAPAAVEEVVSDVVAEPVVEAVAEPVMEAAPSEDPLAALAAEVVAEPAAEAVAEPAAEAVVTEEPVAIEPMPEVEAEPVVEAVVEEVVEAAPEAVTEPEPVPVVEAAAEAPAELNPEATDAAVAAEGIDAAAKLVAQQEEVRRQAREQEGRASLAKGMAAAKANDPDTAISSLQDALAKLPARGSNRTAIDEARAALGQAYLAKATQAFEAGDLKTARGSVNQALQNLTDRDAAESLERKIARAEERDAELRSRPVPVKKRPEVVAKQKSISDLLREGRQYFEVADYNNAEALFEKVLLQDEYNVEAMRYLRKIDDRRYKIRTQEREATTAELMQKVRDAWNPPVREDTTLPERAATRGAIETKTSAQKLQERMEKIIIPSIEFRQANITDVVNFLVEASIQGDPEKAGVNIILNIDQGGGAAADAGGLSAPAPAPAADPFAGGGFGGEFDSGLNAAPAADNEFAAPASGGSSVPTVTLNLRRISLLDAIKYITEVTRLKYRMEDNAVIITPEDMVSGRVVTRLYPVQPSILDVIVEREESTDRTGEFVEMGSSRTSMKKSDVKEFFEKSGVQFPKGTSISYNPTISQLIVANTLENLEVFERILSRLNVIPNQVEIEARFVEIAQDDLEELGLQWILTDNWEIAAKKGPGGVASTEKLQINADGNGITKGLRFFTQNSNTGTTEPLATPSIGTGISPLGNVLSFASILTNPEVKVILQALSQHGGSDLLSAPRVTTRSGVNAQIQVVREIIYPTEFETTQPQFNENGSVTTPPVVTPGSFETRETGVILNVTPTVGPDGYTIDLVMVPEVSELVDWIQYGSSVSIPRTDPITGLFSGDQSFTFNIPQPVFASRNVTTSIVIWDGQTVVMGGLIREDLVKVKDKIPVLGDIPVLGRLFRSEGQYSQKKNLLIFVSARLVDPAGKPIHRGETLGVAEGGDATQAAPTATP